MRNTNLHLKKRRSTYLTAVILHGLTLVLSQVALAEKKEINCANIKEESYQVLGRSLSRPSKLDASEFEVCYGGKQSRTPWLVAKSSWDVADEENFMRFIVQLGNAVENKVCDSVDSCLISPEANNQLSEFDLNFLHYSDCADFPIYLRSYFAFKNKLPMVIGTGLQEAPLTEEQQKKRATVFEKLDAQLVQINGDTTKSVDEKAKAIEAIEKARKNEYDTRYSRNGNVFLGYRVFGTSPNLNMGRSAVNNFLDATKLIHNQISSGSYRMNYTPGMKNPPMFFSPKIDRNNVRVGTVLYNPIGHLSIIYKITDKGEAYYIDAHPDNSVSYNKFSREFVESLQTHAGGFKNWRPFEIKNGRVNLAADEMLQGQVSQEQYTGTGTATNLGGELKKVFEYVGKDKSFLTSDLYQWVACRLNSLGTVSNCQIDPIERFKDNLLSLCAAYQARVKDVMTAINNGVDNKAHPDVLPTNIFGAEGEWETYSTPGRDMRLKQKVLGIMKDVEFYLGNNAVNNSIVKFDGTASELKEMLLKTYASVDRQCQVSIPMTSKTSTGVKSENVMMSLSGLGQRLEFLSFDPYMCSAVRWGATQADELSGCLMSSDKYQWAKALLHLQVQTERDSKQIHGGGLDANLKKSSVLSPIDSRKYDLHYFLKNL